MLIYSASGMKCKEPGAQKVRYGYGDRRTSSTARRSDSPAQPIIQRILALARSPDLVHRLTSFQCHCNNPFCQTIRLKTDEQMQKWQCTVCGFEYDEALGLPHEGIAPGTRWRMCQTTGVSGMRGAKADFIMAPVWSDD